MKKVITAFRIETFEKHLCEDEKSRATVEKYMRDLRAFQAYVGAGEVDKQTVLAYKELLGERYAVASANSMLAALNRFFRFCEWFALCVKPFRMQKRAFCAAERELTKEEYRRLVRAAEQKENERLALVIETICGTGIRVGELSFITVEAARCGQATVSCKGKARAVFLIPALRQKLLRYAKKGASRAARSL